MFRKYVSNTSCGTGTNYILEFKENRRFTARAYFKCAVTGRLNHRFFYMNQVNSTYSDGSVAYRNKPGGNWKILRAVIADGGEIGPLNVEAGELVNPTPVTFDGRAEKTVAPCEKFWSDEVTFDLPENHYLVWEWEIEGNGIPCTPDSQVPTFMDYGPGMKFDYFCPMPALIGIERPETLPAKKRVAFLGDSITQGCQTTLNAYAMWVGKIAAMLAPDYPVWNIGLGFARGSDAATDDCWLWKAKQMDVVVLTCGVNDVLSGEYQAGRPSTAGEIIGWLEKTVRALKEAGVDVIISKIPPYEMNQRSYEEWRAANLAIPAVAALYGCKVYDIESSLDASAVLESRYLYNAHPDDNGGTAAAEKFKATFLTQYGWNL
ncbi:MAG: SGNH/GDSL hydrolase family protein [Clostridia bacterium]|nr:SGNH/GDSL hydrolase family protein [Clostridia bacterium]